MRVKGRQEHVIKNCHEYFNILAVKCNICEKVTDLSIDYYLNLNTNVQCISSHYLLHYVIRMSII